MTTGCEAGKHRFQWTSYEGGAYGPARGTRCLCGAITTGVPYTLGTRPLAPGERYIRNPFT
jgi:hypothetical protein